MEKFIESFYYDRKNSKQNSFTDCRAYPCPVTRKLIQAEIIEFLTVLSVFKCLSFLLFLISN